MNIKTIFHHVLVLAVVSSAVHFNATATNTVREHYVQKAIERQVTRADNTDKRGAWHWIRRQAGRAKRFMKKHKKPLIASAATAAFVSFVAYLLHQKKVAQIRKQHTSTADGIKAGHDSTSQPLTQKNESDDTISLRDHQAMIDGLRAAHSSAVTSLQKKHEEERLFQQRDHKAQNRDIQRQMLMLRLRVLSDKVDQEAEKDSAAQPRRRVVRRPLPPEEHPTETEAIQNWWRARRHSWKQRQYTREKVKRQRELAQSEAAFNELMVRWNKYEKGRDSSILDTNVPFVCTASPAKPADTPPASAPPGGDSPSAKPVEKPKATAHPRGGSPGVSPPQKKRTL